MPSCDDYLMVIAMLVIVIMVTMLQECILCVCVFSGGTDGYFANKEEEDGCFRAVQIANSASVSQGKMTQEDELLQERMRVFRSGISDYFPLKNRFVYFFLSPLRCQEHLCVLALLQPLT